MQNRKKTAKLPNSNPADLVKPVDDITVHGVLTDLSPLKSGRNAPYRKYFSAKFSNGKTLKFVSFNAEMRSKMESRRQEPIAIVSCNFKMNTFKGSSGLEIIASPPKNTVSRSPRNFQLPAAEEMYRLDPELAPSRCVTLQDLYSIVNYQNVTVSVTLS